jgi:hypothetical protein
MASVTICCKWTKRERHTFFACRFWGVDRLYVLNVREDRRVIICSKWTRDRRAFTPNSPSFYSSRKQFAMYFCYVLLFHRRSIPDKYVPFQIFLTPYLTSWSWALLEKPPIVQLLKNFPEFYGTRRFIAVFTSPSLVPTLSQINPIYTSPILCL